MLSAIHMIHNTTGMLNTLYRRRISILLAHTLYIRCLKYKIKMAMTKKHFWKCLLGSIAAVITLQFALHFNSFYVLNNVIDKTEELSFSNAVMSNQSIIKLPYSECKEDTSARNFTNFNKEPQTMKDFLTYRHCRSFPQLLDSPMKCGGPANSKEVSLLLAIKSSPANYERREAVRKTWGVEKTYNGFQVKRIFLIGTPKQKYEKRMMQLLTIESQLYNDVLQWDFYDSFYNLTLKQVLFLTWFEAKCPGAKYIFDGDDDVFVNTVNVITYLNSLSKDGNKHHLFVGALNTNMPPIRQTNRKYYVPQALFKGNKFDPYCGGGGILIASFTAHSIIRESQYIPLFPIDDVYLGMCLARAGLKPSNHEGIKTLGIRLPNVDSFDPCYYRHMLVVHRFVPYEMLIMWNALQITELKCRQKSRVTVEKTNSLNKKLLLE
uniref:Hexosyltransferase n=4 Tax=Xenopus tropicalis TaxID=8364 RepID=A0A6I8RB52_XENTR